MTYWNQFKAFINSKDVGYVFKRQELMSSFPAWGDTATAYSRIEKYRQTLTFRSEYMKWIKPGRYQLLSKVPEDVTLDECFYGIQITDNLKYVQLLDRRRKKRKKEQVHGPTI